MKEHDEMTWSIGILADWFGLSPQTLRVWEAQGLIPKTVRTPGGHRRYTKAHVRAIAALLGIRLIERDQGAGGRP